MSRLGFNLFGAAACAAVATAVGDRAKHPGRSFIAGLAWVQLSEYVWHRLVLHGSGDTLLRRQHVGHHTAFVDGRVSMDDQRTEQVSEHPATFPIAFGIHTFVLRLVFGGAPRQFLQGICAGYALYEAGHWGCHVRNPLDRLLLRLPIVGTIRARQIRHHLDHHNEPTGNYGFTPPYTGDVILATKRIDEPA